MGNLKTRVCCVQCGVSVDRAQERARHVDGVRTTAHGFIPVLENGEVGERLHDGAPCLFRRLCFVEETEYSLSRHPSRRRRTGLRVADGENA
jgi:hypothetical protein